MPTNAIFVFSGFRTASTWFWGKLRQHQELCCYYEPFNELLANLTPANMLEPRPSGWRSHHPDSAAYLLEYGPLLQNSPGVPGFPVEPVLGSSFVGEAGVGGPLDSNVQAYVASLIEGAKARGRRPVLACTRMLGRSAGLRQAFNGYHILLIRNLFQQWNSFAGQARFNNFGFLDYLYKYLWLAERDEFVHYLANYFTVDSRGSLETWLAEDNFDRIFCYFVGFHIYFLLHARRNADLVIDLNALAHSGTHYRRTIEKRIKADIGISVDLSDVRENIDYPLHLIKRPDECKALVRGMADKALQICAATADERVFIASLLQDLWDEHERFSRSTTGVVDLIQTFEQQIAAEAGRTEELANRVGGLEQDLAGKNEREAALEEALSALRQQHDEVLAEREAARSAATTEAERAHGLDAQHAALSLQCAELQAEHNRLQSTLAQAQAEQAALSHQRDQIAIERAQLAADYQHLLEQNASRGRKLDEAQARLDTLEHDLGYLDSRRRQRDEELSQLGANLETATARTSMLQAELTLRLQELANTNAALREAQLELSAWEDARLFKLPPPQIPLMGRWLPFRRSRRLRRAREAARKGQWTFAAEQFRLVLAERSDTPHVWVEYGHALKEAGALADAARVYRKVLLLLPDHHDMEEHLSALLDRIRQ